MQVITVSTSVTTSNKAEFGNEQCLGEQVVYIQVLKIYASIIISPQILKWHFQTGSSLNS